MISSLNEVFIYEKMRNIYVIKYMYANNNYYTKTCVLFGKIYIFYMKSGLF